MDPTEDEILISLATLSDRGRARLEGIVAYVVPRTVPPAAGDAEAPRLRLVDDGFHVPREDAAAVYATLASTDDVCLLRVANRLLDEMRARGWAA
ncbi:MAG: hypothetical protein JNM10_19680 [Planctomycetia bacterium]|nr:hypothetical protein [Planctomycetia bacterium]